MFLTACGHTYLTPTTSPTSNVTTTPVLHLSTPTLKSQVICPSSGSPSNPMAPSQMNILWIKETINDYLDQGGSPEETLSELTLPKYGNLKIEMNRVDIDNDGIDELIFSSGVLFPTNGSTGVDSGLWLFRCENYKYKVIYQIVTLGSYEGNPRLVDAVDLNNDKQKEIIIRSTWRGSGCLQSFFIASLEKGKSYLTHLLNKSEYFPCDTEFAIGNDDINGNKEVLFMGKSDARYDAVAGIQRDFIDTYILNNKVYILKSHEYLPSPYRVYAIYEAQQALDKGDVYHAIEFYDKAAHDQTLLDVDSVAFRYAENLPQNLSKKDHPKEYVSAFALFRLVVLHLQVNQEQKSTSMLKELEENYPSGKVGSEFTEAAQLFVEHFKSGEKPFLSCQAVSSMIENKYPFLEWHFRWSTWTYFEYTNRRLCSYFSEK